MVKARSKGEFEGEKVLNEGEKVVRKPLEAKKSKDFNCLKEG